MFEANSPVELAIPTIQPMYPVATRTPESGDQLLECPKRIGMSEMDTTKFAVLGSLMIVSMETAMFPLNTIQIIAMSQRTRQKQPSLLDTVRKVVRAEGVARLWRGIIPQTIGALPGQACYYIAYESVHESLATASPELSKFPFLRGFVSGACADLAGGIFYVPADIVAQRLQTQNSGNFSFSHNKRLYRGAVDVCRRVIKIEGFKGFWRGYTGYVCAFAPASAVQWGVFELCKLLLFPVFAKLRIESPETYSIPISGGVAGFCALCANNPLEVMRVRMQLLESGNKNDAEAIKRGYWKLGLQIWRTEGLRAFYRGLNARLLTTLPGIILAMTGYEYVKESASV